MKRLIQISFWEEVIVYNAKKKNDDIQIKKKMFDVIKIIFPSFFLQLIIFFIDGQKYPQDS